MEEARNRNIRIGIVDNDPYALKVFGALIERMSSDFAVIWTCDLGAVAISTAASVSIPAGETTWGAVFIANGLQLILAVLLIVLGLNIVFHSFKAYKNAEHNSEAKV